MKNRERLIRRLRKALSRKSFQNRFNKSLDHQWQTMEQLEERMLLSVTAVDDVYNINEDEVFRTGNLTQVIGENDNWDYQNNISNATDTYPTDALGSAWNSPIFDVNTSDAAIGPWSNAAAPFAQGTINGFANATPEIIPTDLGTTSADNTTVLYRSEAFDVDDSSIINQIQLSYLFDDSGIVYLNGTEIFRLNIDDNPPAVTDLANGNGNEDTFTTATIALPGGILNDTGNVIAVETHNTQLDSSDHGMYLTAAVIESAGMGVLENDDLSSQVGPLTVDNGVGNNVLTVQDDNTLEIVGTATILPNGDFTYTPTLPNYNGTASFEYVITDDEGSSSAFVTLNIDPVNDAPTGNPDSYTAGEGEAISATGASAPVLIDFGSTWEYNDNVNNGGDGNPIDGYPEDGNGLFFLELGYDINTSDPSIGPWSVAAGPFEAGNINAFDADSGNQLAGVPVTGLAGVDDALDGSNSVTTYLFRQEFTGNSATTTLLLEYVVDDGAVFYLNGQEIFRNDNMLGLGMPPGTDTEAGGTEDEDNIRSTLIDVTGIMNDGDNVLSAEVHQNNTGSSDVGFAVKVTDVTETPGVLVNDPPDVDGDAVTAQLVDDLALQDLQNFGTLVFNSDGTFTFTPSGSVAGDLTFNYVVTDNIATSAPIPVTLSFTPVDAGPVTANDDNYTTPEDTPLVIDDTTTEGTLGFGPLVNDVPVAGDETDPIQIVVTDQSNLNGTLDINGDGTFTYTPNANFSGQASFTYEVHDVGFPLSISNPATVTIDVTPVDDAPVGVADNYNVDEDTTLVVNVPGFEGVPIIDFGDVWFYLDDGIDQGTAWSAPGFDPAAAGWESGPAELGYGDTDEATVLEFGPDPDNKYPTTYFQRTFDVTDPGSVEGLFLNVHYDDGVAVYINGVEVLRSELAAGATFSDFANGGTGDDRFATANVDVDALGLNLQETGNTIAVEIHQGNATSSDISFDLEMQTSAVGILGLLGNDSDPDQGDSIGNASIVPGQGAHNGTLTLNTDGTFTYTPNPDYFGTDTFFYTIEDSDGTVSNPTRVDIVVNPIDDPVTGVDDSYMVLVNETLDVAAADLDATFGTAGGTVLVNEGSNWNYLDDGSDQGTAWTDPGFNDTSWLNGDAELGYGDGDEATVVGFGPDDQNKYTTTYFRHAFDVTDPGSVENLIIYLLRDDGAAVYINGVEVVRDNLIPMAAANELATDDAGPEGAFYAFAVNLADAGVTLLETGNVVAAEVHQVLPTSTDISFDLRIEAVDELPAVGVLANDIDPDDEALTAVLVDAPLNHDDTVAPFALNGDGTFTYDPVEDFVGTDSFTYEIQDGTGAVVFGPSTVTIEVKSDELDLNPGDFNGDDMADATDINLLAEAINTGNMDSIFDTDDDGDVDTDDYDFMIENILGTLAGDANLDGIINLEDLAKLATFFGQSGQGWGEGDFTGDGLVNLEDLAKLATFFGQSPGGGAIDYSGGAAASGEALLGATDGDDDDDDSSWDHIASVLD